MEKREMRFKAPRSFKTVILYCSQCRKRIGVHTTRPDIYTSEVRDHFLCNKGGERCMDKQ